MKHMIDGIPTLEEAEEMLKEAASVMAMYGSRPNMQDFYWL